MNTLTHWLVAIVFIGVWMIGTAALDGPDDIETAQMTADAVAALGEGK